MAVSLRDFTFGDPQLAEFASLAEEHRSLHPSIPLAQLRKYVERLADMVRPTSDFAPRERGIGRRDLLRLFEAAAAASAGGSGQGLPPRTRLGKRGGAWRRQAADAGQREARLPGGSEPWALVFTSVCPPRPRQSKGRPEGGPAGRSGRRGGGAAKGFRRIRQTARRSALSRIPGRHVQLAAIPLALPFQASEAWAQRSFDELRGAACFAHCRDMVDFEKPRRAALGPPPGNGRCAAADAASRQKSIFL
jgi:hypothetical protein